jgi:hypothetical protein
LVGLSKGFGVSALLETSLCRAGVAGGDMGPLLGCKVAMVYRSGVYCADERQGVLRVESAPEGVASHGYIPQSNKQAMAVVVPVGGGAQRTARELL